MKRKLAAIEARLQALIEGGAARLFPQRRQPDDLAYRLVEAMWAGASPGPDGSHLAPNLYTLLAAPQRARSLETNPELLDVLRQVLHETSRQAGLRFSGPVAIRVQSDPQLAPQEILVLAKNSQDTLADTSDLVVGFEKKVSFDGAQDASFDCADDGSAQDALSGAQSYALSEAEGEVEAHSNPSFDFAQDAPFDAQRAGRGAGESPIPENAFLIVDGQEIFQLNQAVINIGRRPDNQLVIPDPRVSRVHAQLRAVRQRFILFDLDSTGGTFVNGERIHQATLFPGDVISLAGLPVVYGQEDSHPGGTETIHPEEAG
jgi:hypothetical protein